MKHLNPCRDCGAGRDQDCDESCDSGHAAYVAALEAEVDEGADPMSHLRFTLTIDSGNAAVVDAGWEAEVARLLRDAAAQVERGQLGNVLRDYNGNVVGSFSTDRGADR